MVTHKVPDIKQVILLAPTDMVGWAETDPRHESYLAEAKRLQAKGKGESLVGAECWLDKTPLSAQTYPSLCEAGGAADIYGDREDGPLLGRLTVPTLILYGDQDIGITEIDGSMAAWLDRTRAARPANAQMSTLEDAPHSFRGHEQVMSQIVIDFAQNGPVR